MTQYILLIQNNAKSQSSPAEWDTFFSQARESGLFRGGSAIGKREIIGDIATGKPTDFIGGYMTFNSEDKYLILDLLQKHPVVIHGGSVELCELSKT